MVLKLALAISILANVVFLLAKQQPQPAPRPTIEDYFAALDRAKAQAAPAPVPVIVLPMPQLPNLDDHWAGQNQKEQAEFFQRLNRETR